MTKRKKAFIIKWIPSTSVMYLLPAIISKSKAKASTPSAKPNIRVYIPALGVPLFVNTPQRNTVDMGGDRMAKRSLIASKYRWEFCNQRRPEDSHHNYHQDGNPSDQQELFIRCGGPPTFNDIHGNHGTRRI